MTTVLNLTGISLPNGTTNIPQVAVPAGVTKATATLDRNTPGTPTLWPNVATTISLDLMVSYDGGATFTYGGGFTAAGGVVNDASGNPSASSVCSFGYSVQPTHVKGTMTITSGPLLTNVSVVTG